MKVPFSILFYGSPACPGLIILLERHCLTGGNHILQYSILLHHSWVARNKTDLLCWPRDLAGKVRGTIWSCCCTGCIGRTFSTADFMGLSFVHRCALQLLSSVSGAFLKCQGLEVLVRHESLPTKHPVQMSNLLWKGSYWFPPLVGDASKEHDKTWTWH